MPSAYDAKPNKPELPPYAPDTDIVYDIDDDENWRFHGLRQPTIKKKVRQTIHTTKSILSLG